MARLAPRALCRCNKIQIVLDIANLFFFQNIFLTFFSLAPKKGPQKIVIHNCWTEMLAQSLGHIIILVHFRSKR
jgi:hypothetical protein